MALLGRAPFVYTGWMFSNEFNEKPMSDNPRRNWPQLMGACVLCLALCFDDGRWLGETGLDGFVGQVFSLTAIGGLAFYSMWHVGAMLSDEESSASR